MNQWEKAIREKVFAANILTPGEWVYLVGLFHLSNEHEEQDKGRQGSGVRAEGFNSPSIHQSKVKP